MNELAVVVADSDLVTSWLGDFESALRKHDAEAISSLFADECHWRDLVAFTWNITPFAGRKAISEGLTAAQAAIEANAFALAAGRTPPRRLKRLGVEVIEAIFKFETLSGRGFGVVRLLADRPTVAWTLMTSLQELKGNEEPVGQRRPSGDAYSRNFGGDNWSDLRSREQAFSDQDPAVLIIGAGQAGLTLAARLRLLGIPALVVDRSPRVGDVWRGRYHSLALHNGVELNHMAYMPFPPSWPNLLPKDMLGNWLESYAWAMECNVWTNTTFVGGSHDEGVDCWNAHVRRGDGSERVLRPRHLIFANGLSGKARIPQLPGLEEFRGELMHTEAYKAGAAWRGKRAIVLGTGTSGHDVAQDLHNYGADVKVIQRSSTTVVSLKSAKLVHSVYYEEGLPTADADLIATVSTYPLLIRGYQSAVKRMLEIDRELLAGLTERGFKHDMGEDNTGHQMKFRRRHGGYYLDCGCADLIIKGKIGLLQWDEVEQFVADGIRMKDGTIEKADLLVAATGYEPPSEVVRQLLGDKVAEKVGQVWGIAPDGELSNMFRPTPQKGLWFIGGGLAHARIYSHFIALQIKARETGLIQ
jgi:cation diffusion facilitator CzcD-associated flavoprotein CzcO